MAQVALYSMVRSVPVKCCWGIDPAVIWGGEFMGEIEEWRGFHGWISYIGSGFAMVLVPTQAADI